MTEPEAAEGATVAVSVRLPPELMLLALVARVVVVAVVEELLVALLHPVRPAVVSNATMPARERRRNRLRAMVAEAP